MSATQELPNSDRVLGKFLQEGVVIGDNLHALHFGEGDEEGVIGFT